MSAAAVGSPAPEFELPDQHGVQITSSGFATPVLVVFYPFAFTGTCTGELRELSELAAQRDDVSVLAISCDTMFAQRTFAEAEELDLVLLSDFWPHGAVASAYGAFDEDRGCPQRASFVIAAGIVRWSVVRAIAEPRDVADYHRVLDELAMERAAVPSTHPGGPSPAV